MKFSGKRRKSANPPLLRQYPGCTFCIVTPSTRALQQDRCAPWAVPRGREGGCQSSRSTAAPPCRRSRDAARREPRFRHRHCPRYGAGCECTWEPLPCSAAPEEGQRRQRQGPPRAEQQLPGAGEPKPCQQRTTRPERPCLRSQRTGSSEGENQPREKLRRGGQKERARPRRPHRPRCRSSPRAAPGAAGQRGPAGAKVRQGPARGTHREDAHAERRLQHTRHLGGALRHRRRLRPAGAGSWRARGGRGGDSAGG